MKKVKVLLTEDIGNEWFLLLCCLALAIIARFIWLQYMEYKSDEFTAILLAYRNIHSGIQLVGLRSSIGLPNPPFFIYLLSIPVWFTVNPIAITVFIGLLNVLGVALLFVFVRFFFRFDIALWTVTLFSSAPWTIIYSRKIWAQNALFPFLILFYFLFFSAMHRYKRWKLICSAVVLACAMQLHISAWFIPIPILLFLLLERPTYAKKDIFVSVLAFAIPWIPYIAFFISTDWEALLRLFARSHNSTGELAGHISWIVNISTGLGFEYLLGKSTMLSLEKVTPIFVLTNVFRLYLLILCIAVLIASSTIFCTKIGGIQRSILRLFILILLSIPLVYCLLGVRAFPHYSIVFYPIISLIVAWAIHLQFLPIIRDSGVFYNIQRWLKTFVLLMIIANITYTYSFLFFIRLYPHEISGDYGKPYIIMADKHIENIRSFSTTVRDE